MNTFLHQSRIWIDPSILCQITSHFPLSNPSLSNQSGEDQIFEQFVPGEGAAILGGHEEASEWVGGAGEEGGEETGEVCTADVQEPALNEAVFGEEVLSGMSDGRRIEVIDKKRLIIFAINNFWVEKQLIDQANEADDKNQHYNFKRALEFVQHPEEENSSCLRMRACF